MLRRMNDYRVFTDEGSDLLDAVDMPADNSGAKDPLDLEDALDDESDELYALDENEGSLDEWADSFSGKRPVRSFGCTDAELAEVRKVVGRPVSAAAVRGAVAAAAGRAVTLARVAAAALEVSPRSTRVRTIFCESFGVAPEFVPLWRATLPGTVRWRDLGELVAIRLRSAAGILDGGFIRYFCWGSPAECRRECSDPSGYFACSSFQGRYIICLGRHFWLAFRDGDTATLASTLLHEALHIYYRRTVSDVGRSGNANCSERFVIRFHGLRLHRATDAHCPAGVCRAAPAPPAAPTILDRFPLNGDAVEARHRPLLAQIARLIVVRSQGPRPVQAVRLAGHTDPSGPARNNVILGRRRAQAAQRMLALAVDRLRHGLSRRIRFMLESHGATRPLANNATIDGRARNRRVEISLA